MCDCNSQSIFLFRFTELLDSVLHYLLPSWNYSAGSFKDLEVLHIICCRRNGKCIMSVFCVERYVIIEAV